MLLRIVSSEWELYHWDVEKVILPTDNGFLWIFPGHVNLVTPLTSWIITYLPKNKPTSNLDQFADHSATIEVNWWLAMIDNEVITIATE